jgi:hypothetical protein
LVAEQENVKMEPQEDLVVQAEAAQAAVALYQVSAEQELQDKVIAEDLAKVIHMQEAEAEGLAQ